ncbi:MAG: hypothetical protein ACRETM_08255 [Stenotrophobium sp.]
MIGNVGAIKPPLRLDAHDPTGGGELTCALVGSLLLPQPPSSTALAANTQAAIRRQTPLQFIPGSRSYCRCANQKCIDSIDTVNVAYCNIASIFARLANVPHRFLEFIQGHEPFQRFVRIEGEFALKVATSACRNGLLVARTIPRP